MRISLISLSTPTFNNVRAASALPYHLMVGAKAAGNVEFEVYSYNVNHIDADGIAETERELGVKIRLLERPWWMTWMFRLRLGMLRVLLKYPYLSYLRIPGRITEEIKSASPDIIWIYGEEIAGFAKKFEGFRRVVTMPDCESMYYHRLLAKRFAITGRLRILRYAFAYWQYRFMEQNGFQRGVAYHFVGRADAEFYKAINPNADAMFLRHPLYAYDASRPIRFSNEKIKLLFAGRYDFYCRHGSDELLGAMVARRRDLADGYEITFLGKGWETWNETLRAAGFSSSHIAYAPNYIEELRKHDIQVNAVDVGTGTKGKVLDAIANGLLAFGTRYALENIAVRNGESCVEYATAGQAMDMMLDIRAHRAKYEQMAERGRQEVWREHDRARIASALFNGNRV